MKVLSIDFEYNNTSEKYLNLVCCSIYDSETKETKSWWLDGKNEEEALDLSLFLKGKRAEGYVFLAHNVVAEASSFIALNLNPAEFKWIDTFIEFRMLTNHNSDFTYGNHLFGKEVTRIPLPEPWGKQPRKLTHGYAQMVYKLLKVKIDTDHKNEMRDLIISAPKQGYTEKQKADIIAYCESDLTHLLPCLKIIVKYYKKHLKDRDIKHEILWRGESSARTALMEREGYPILHQETWNFSKSVPQMLREVQKDICQQFPEIAPFEYIKKTQKYVKKEKRIRDWIDTTEFKDRWELTATGNYSLGIDAFKKFFNYRHNYPRGNFGAQMVRFLHLKQGLNGFIPSENKKTIWSSTGEDGRVRPYLNPYGSQSARYQPSATSFIFLKAAWMRALVQPNGGSMIVGIDYSSEEFLISAIISKDKSMYDAYVSGDVYLAFGKDSGVIPKDGTKKSHPVERQMCKGVVLGLSYGMTKVGLALALSAELKREVTEDEAQEWIDLFKETYPANTEWREDIIDQYEDSGRICLLDGWTMWDSNLNERSVANVPIQGAGSCVLRYAVKLCQDAGLKVIIPLHDALYVEMDSKDWESVEIFKKCMHEAFIYYFDGEDKEWASQIGLDVECWGPDLDEDSHDEYKCEKIHIDERSISEYEQFSKYFKTPDIELV